MSTSAELMAKLLLNDNAVSTLLGDAEESEVSAVSNVLSVSYLCSLCVSNLTKEVVSTTGLRMWRHAQKRKRGRRNLHRPFSEDLQTLLFSQLCLAAPQGSKI